MKTARPGRPWGARTWNGTSDGQGRNGGGAEGGTGGFETEGSRRGEAGGRGAEGEGSPLERAAPEDLALVAARLRPRWRQERDSTGADLSGASASLASGTARRAFSLASQRTFCSRAC